MVCNVLNFIFRPRAKLSGSNMNWDECAIVDDNRFDRLICDRIVSRIAPDLKINEFINGREILDYLTSVSFSSKKLLILLDINMPEMNGHEFLNEITLEKYKQLHDRFNVVIITSSTRKEDQTLSTQFDLVMGYLQKPILVDHLKKIIS